jgi:hypothetical protein
MKRILILITFMIAFAGESLAQCAMCRATLENNLSNGQPGLAAGINFGIMYLFFTPYLAVAVIAYLWYRTSRNGVSKYNHRTLEG